MYLYYMDDKATELRNILKKVFNNDSLYRANEKELHSFETAMLIFHFGECCSTITDIVGKVFKLLCLDAIDVNSKVSFQKAWAYLGEDENRLLFLAAYAQSGNKEEIDLLITEISDLSKAMEIDLNEITELADQNDCNAL